MKLSEAIALGRHTLKPRPGYTHSTNNKMGCVLGMAENAVGWSNKNRFVAWDDNHWPWLLKKNFSLAPCGCGEPLSQMDGFRVIAHLFDCHVCARKDLTIEQLIDCVQSIEPEEETGSARAEREDVMENQASAEQLQVK